MSLDLPSDAPFNDIQRMWLKGFFAGLGGGGGSQTSATPAAAAKTPGDPIAILWGSQTGTAEAYAKQLAKKAKAAGLAPSIHELSSIAPTDLPKLGTVAILTSTYGDGEPPDNATEFHAALMAEELALAGVKYSVFALGDSNYPAFCQCGRDFDSRLETLGGVRVAPRVEGDADFDTPFATWSETLLGALIREPVVA